MTTIRIGEIPYELLVVQELVDKSGVELDGRLSEGTQEMRLRNGLGVDYTRRTLVHEIVHSVLFNTGHAEQSADEDLITALVFGLAATFLDYDYESGPGHPLIDPALLDLAIKGGSSDLPDERGIENG